MENIYNYILDEETLAEHYKESGNTYGYESKSKLVEYLKELKTYKDAEEQGLLTRLPCKVGDTVYQVNHLRKCVSSFKVKAVSVTSFGFWIEWELLEGMYINLNGFNSEEIGKTVFLTKKAAEQALAEMKGE